MSRGAASSAAAGRAPSQFDGLIDVYGLTRLDAPDGEVIDVGSASSLFAG